MTEFRVVRCLHINAAIARISAGTRAVLVAEHDSLADKEFVGRLVEFLLELVVSYSTYGFVAARGVAFVSAVGT